MKPRVLTAIELILHEQHDRGVSDAIHGYGKRVHWRGVVSFGSNKVAVLTSIGLFVRIDLFQSIAFFSSHPPTPVAHTCT